jgi:hypothetical protein
MQLEAESPYSTIPIPNRADPDILLIPLEREVLRRFKGVKFSDAELEKIEKFQEWLATTNDPRTGQPFIPRNEFSALIQFCINTTMHVMRQVAAEMAQAEEP